ncbi:unnamed protein product [Danaus chrysippus]|uniref:(African queen) hypothetical protein n=1 Tax=Danaus chrysippus TaxID=151541 RepID=A0A8J2QXD8_9NEOP|nr:unnamed protein product [Danaus chrysippus]
MASTKIFATAAFICLLSLFQQIDSTQITNRDVSSILSLLNRNIVGNKKPVIIILEKEPGLTKKNKPALMTSSEEHNSINIPHVLHEKLNYEGSVRLSTPSYLNLLQQRGQKNRMRHRAERNRVDEDDVQRTDKQILRSPIVKKLLRISNSLRCDAKDDCQDKCSNKYNGKKVVTCKVQCEVKYECDQPEPEKDACESGCEDSCGNDNECDNAEDDLRSLCNLELELTEYFDRSESRTYHELYPGAEMINYDFTAERQNIYSTNLIESIAHLIKGCLGAGLLGMHEAFKYGGLWTSLAVTLIIGYVITYCMIMLVSSAQTMYGRLRVPRLSYPDLAEVALATGPFKISRRASKIFRISAAASLSDLPAWNDVQGFFRLMGICIFSINGIGVTLPVENNMRKPKYFKTVLLWAMPIVISFNAAIGFFGYWAWGEKCKSPFTIHMPSNTKKGIWERMYRCIHVLVLSGFCVALPDMMTWMTFIGNVFTAFLLFIFPAFIEILVMWREPKRRKFRSPRDPTQFPLLSRLPQPSPFHGVLIMRLAFKYFAKISSRSPSAPDGTPSVKSMYGHWEKVETMIGQP